MLAKYDKDQYQLQLRQLDSLKQTGSVTDYQKRFDELAHDILLYNLGFDDTYLVTRFLGGLKEQIRSAIALHRPPDVDTASALALLQEEELSHSSFGANRQGQYTKRYGQADKGKSVESEPSSSNTIQGTAVEKLESLKAHRRKNGLCFKCGEKWSKTHKCPANISIHVMEELLDALEFETHESEEVLEPTMDDQTVLVLTAIKH